MSDDDITGMYDDIFVESIHEGICSDTQAGWLWYCDEHNTHGNADSREEADVISDAHIEFFAMASANAPDEDGNKGTGEVDENDYNCDIEVWYRNPTQ